MCDTYSYYNFNVCIVVDNTTLYIKILSGYTTDVHMALYSRSLSIVLPDLYSTIMHAALYMCTIQYMYN